MKIRYSLVTIIMAMLVFVSACSEKNIDSNHGVYLLIDTSGTYADELKSLKNAQLVIEYVLKRVKPGDNFTVQKIDSNSFSEKDIVHSQIFDSRRVQTAQQRNEFRKKIDAFIKNVKPSSYTDISGGLRQGIEFLNETRAAKKTILIFSDMKEELPKGYKRGGHLNLEGITVIALKVVKLKSDNINPQEYEDRLKHWQARVEDGGGTWMVINNLDNLKYIYEEQAE